ncbi:hypothetical protein Hanom_Chr03g00209151 [Helianthus anomalus]
MHREWDAFEVSKKEAVEEKAKVAMLRAKLEADQTKFESEQKTEECSAVGWKRKAKAEHRSLRPDMNNLKAEIKRLKKENAEAESARDEAQSHREQIEQREVQTCATLALKNKEIEELTSLLTGQEQTKPELESAKKDLQLERVEKDEVARRLAKTEEKLESSETARATAERLVVNSILNSIDLDQTVANLMVAARNDGYTQGYAECTQHVTDALRVEGDNSRSASR